MNLLALDAVKTLLGILLTDATHDAALNAAMPVITEYFESYCKRGLAFVPDVVEEMRGESRLGLFRYPVESVNELLIDGIAPPVMPSVDKAHGIVLLGTNWSCYVQLVKVTYHGGYPQASVPADLAMAYARCCADAGGVTYAAGGAGAGAPLKSLGLGSGALTVQFDTSAAAHSAYDTSAVPPLLAPYLFVLEHYRMKDYA